MPVRRFNLLFSSVHRSFFRRTALIFLFFFLFSPRRSLWSDKPSVGASYRVHAYLDLDTSRLKAQVSFSLLKGDG
ncbi:hypothetical protein L249_8246 [Ophiocordyceps polyrhachis-furcata BCC 54312]|uniref:Uncharacterized protein n=1 Tax=Ophiocordyceps polyrhachis-furcata BCC 54312 TaxID=1330021 RepID=A0A367LHV6_9HYPO|nr:hypothetical protein L249_8246 [Ophiocordyceps polyrhachis-furcata BCC 54312]